ncbi:Molybdenum cofactor biosynthesis protein 1 [Venturia nashicola]|uniref:Molybdenum cofactor biosynthesis protein 1 n=1 Tax=Venturia nashicola TaxID=86259 RepID=A0A4Z1PCB6_9PEZI|nr:Molybdenum cofactor biosynthesis protein 1 [Venturia nashicola]TLD38932.1 Molybdenum cofactor biosynthesis protein 1 [Venturia nashicola]
MDHSPSRSSPPNSHSMTTPPSRPNLTRQPSKLLPAFEPFSSSPPGLPSKRKFNAIDDERVSYPTPAPTSSTGILPSSPPRRQALQRTLSTLSERAPLSDLPSVAVPPNGEPMRFGRSSNSSDHQFPTNRHISRVHVTAQYQPPSDSHASSSILVKCLGWNGAKVRCGGRLYELDKGDSWVSTQPSAEIMLDVMDCRVMVKWPTPEQQRSNSVRSSSAWTDDSSPRRVFAGLGNTVLPSSPPAMRGLSPTSPVLARRNLSSDILTSEATFVSDQTAVHVYEDDSSDHVYADPESPSKSVQTRPPLRERASMTSFSSSNADDLSDQENENEENDPVVHSFGPYGSNLLHRLDSLSHTSSLQPQQRKKKVLKAVSESSKRESPVFTKKIDPAPKKQIQESPVKNHVINQLAFSRVHAMPLSLIHSNLPADLKTCIGLSIDEGEDLTDSDLRRVLHAIPCVGEINRQGKDAAGKPLENEFYYVPEMDDNTMRRDAVLGGRGGTGLRSVRKNHKQYYWKKPRV